VIGRVARAASAGELTIGPVRVSTNSEPLSDEDRDAIAEAWGAPVHNLWGSTEIGVQAVGCGEGDGLHICEDEVILERVDADGRPVGPDEPAARTLATGLAGRTFPFIRYDLGDEVAILSERCACGSAMRRVADIAGRRDDDFRYGDCMVPASAFRYVLGTDPRISTRCARPRTAPTCSWSARPRSPLWRRPWSRWYGPSGCRTPRSAQRGRADTAARLHRQALTVHPADPLNVREQNAEARPAIAGALPAVGTYDTVLLGTGIWSVRPPMIMRTFVESVDLSGRRSSRSSPTPSAAWAAPSMTTRGCAPIDDRQSSPCAASKSGTQEPGGDLAAAHRTALDVRGTRPGRPRRRAGDDHAGTE
jgi:hypothetical protein